jgi:hypothetical protein
LTEGLSFSVPPRLRQVRWRVCDEIFLSGNVDFAVPGLQYTNREMGGGSRNRTVPRDLLLRQRRAKCGSR